MTDLTDEQINEQIEAAYETLRTVVEQLGKKGASPLTLGVALIGVAVEIAVSVGGRDGETLIRGRLLRTTLLRIPRPKRQRPHTRRRRPVMPQPGGRTESGGYSECDVVITASLP